MRVKIALFGIFLLSPLGYSTETLTFVTGEKHAPFTDSNMPHGGYTSYLLKNFYSKHLNKKIRITFLPWKRGALETKTGKWDGTFPYVINEKRKEEFLVSKPITTVHVKLFVSPKSKIKNCSHNHLQNARVCTPIGYAREPFIISLREKKIIKDVSAPDIDSCFKMLADSRVDVVVINSTVGWSVVTRLFKSKKAVRMLPKTIKTNTYHILFPKNQTGAKNLAEFNKFFPRYLKKYSDKLNQDYQREINE